MAGARGQREEWLRLRSANLGYGRQKLGLVWLRLGFAWLIFDVAVLPTTAQGHSVPCNAHRRRPGFGFILGESGVPVSLRTRRKMSHIS